MSGVEVRVGSRLHFGFLDLSLEGDRVFGSLGVGIGTPEFVVEAYPSDVVSVSAPREIEDVVERYVRESLKYINTGGGVDLWVVDGLPRHMGLGSGTRMALSVSTAVSRIYDASFDVVELASALGRGKRSGVGVATYREGGFVVDDGHPTDTFGDPSERDIPQASVSESLPETWRWVVAIPSSDSSSPSGGREDRFIEEVIQDADPSVSEKIRGELSDRVLPGAREGDIEVFGAGIEEIDRLNGVWFRDKQQGVYSEPQLVEFGRSLDTVYASGQSSWGPATYFLTTEKQVSETENRVENFLSHRSQGEIHIASTDREGYSVRQIERDTR